MRVRLGGVKMANLKNEYTDIKNIRHKVQHFTVKTNDFIGREYLMKELFFALTKKNKNISA